MFNHIRMVVLADQRRRFARSLPHFRRGKQHAVSPRAPL